MRTGLDRLAVVAVLVTGLVVGVGAEPAAAFASTGTVTVQGWYWYSYRSDTTTYPSNDNTVTETRMVIESATCADSWAGTTAAGTSAGATCRLQLAGSHWASYIDGSLYSSSSTSMQFTGTYASSNGRGYRLVLQGDGPMTGTIVSTSDPYVGPATVAYQTIANTSTTCSTACSPDYYSTSSGWITLTLHYVVH